MCIPLQSLLPSLTWAPADFRRGNADVGICGGKHSGREVAILRPFIRPLSTPRAGQSCQGVMSASKSSASLEGRRTEVDLWLGAKVGPGEGGADGGCGGHCLRQSPGNTCDSACQSCCPSVLPAHFLYIFSTQKPLLF